MSAPLPAWLHIVSCKADGCDAAAMLWFDSDHERGERYALVARAASGLGWLWVARLSFCPVHADRLRAALLDGLTGQYATDVRWALAERLHLCRIEVTP